MTLSLCKVQHQKLLCKVQHQKLRIIFYRFSRKELDDITLKVKEGSKGIMTIRDFQLVPK